MVSAVVLPFDVFRVARPRSEGSPQESTISPPVRTSSCLANGKMRAILFLILPIALVVQTVVSQSQTRIVLAKRRYIVTRVADSWLTSMSSRPRVFCPLFMMPYSVGCFSNFSRGHSEVRNAA